MNAGVVAGWANSHKPTDEFRVREARVHGKDVLYLERWYWYARGFRIVAQVESVEQAMALSDSLDKEA